MPKKGKGAMTGAAMTFQTQSPTGGVKMETFVPWKFVRRGIKRQVILPNELPAPQPAPATNQACAQLPIKDSALLRAIGLAHYWQMLLDTKKVRNAAEIAIREKVDVSQVRRLMRLTLLSPRRVEFIASQATQELTLDWILRHPLTDDWCFQDSQLETKMIHKK
jgi:hypothetical protein